VARDSGRRRRGLCTGGQLRRRSGLPWVTARTGRDAAGRDVRGSLTGSADCFLERRRGVAGKAPGGGGLRPSTDASICCENWTRKGISRRVRSRGEGWDRNGRLYLAVEVESMRRRR
jgi:hypothetical protein